MVNGTRVFFIKLGGSGYPETAEEAQDWHWQPADPDLYFSAEDNLNLCQDPETGSLFWLSDDEEFKEDSLAPIGRPPSMFEVVAILGNYAVYLEEHGTTGGTPSLALVYDPKTVR